MVAPTAQIQPNISRVSGRAALAGVMAVFSLSACVVTILVALLGFVHAMWAMLALPAVGISAAVLGYSSMKQIERSGGALRGRVPALVGLFLGLMTAATQVAMSIGPLSTFYASRNALAPAMGRMFLEVARADSVAAGRYISQSTEAPAIERLSVVLESAERRLGLFKGATFNMRTLTLAAHLARSAPVPSAAAGAASQSAPPDGQRVITLVFDRGEALLVMWLDNPALERDEVRLLDGFIVLNPEAVGSAAVPEVLLLRSDGPASRTAGQLGVKVIEP